MVDKINSMWDIIGVYAPKNLREKWFEKVLVSCVSGETYRDETFQAHPRYYNYECDVAATQCDIFLRNYQQRCYQLVFRNNRIQGLNEDEIVKKAQDKILERINRLEKEGELQGISYRDYVNKDIACKYELTLNSKPMILAWSSLSGFNPDLLPFERIIKICDNHD